MTKYDAGDIQVLEGLEPVRRRPGMYIGSTDQKGLHHLVTELVDNSVDESLAGFAKNVWVVINKDDSVSVADDGRGIPVDQHPKVKKSALEVAMTYLHAGGKFGGGRGYKVYGGLHGVGASAVNALSEWLMVEVKRGNKIYLQEYIRGKAKAEVVDIKESKAQDLAGDIWKNVKTGTLTTFMADNKIFSTTSLDFKTFEKQIRERAYLVHGLFFHLYDFRGSDEKHFLNPQGRRNVVEKNFYFEGGITSLVTHLNKNKHPVHQPIYIQKDSSGLGVEVAIQYNDSYSETVESFANVINTTEGGTHLTGFRIALTRGINDYARKIGALKSGEDNLTGDDMREGLLQLLP